MLSQILVLFFFPFNAMAQRTLSHGLPLLNRGHPPPLHQPHFLPLMRAHPPSPPENYSPTPLPPLLNTPLPSTLKHHHSAPPHRPIHSPYLPKENYNDVYDVPSNYHFTYHVSDHYSGDVHHHSESKTEQKTEGQYSVKLPDGRTQVVTYTADDGGYHATVEYHGDIIHHPPHPRHHPHPALHRPTLFADPILNEIPSLEKFSPAPEPPLLPKLFVPQDHVLVKKRPFKKPALKLDDLPPPPPPSPIVAPTLAPHYPTLKYRYSPTPTPYPAHERFLPTPLAHASIVKPTFYKGKLVFLDKP